MIRSTLARAALVGASLAVLAMAAPAAAQDASSVPPLVYTHRELANGLDVYAMPDASAGTVTITVWYNVGGKDDPEGRSGFAHLFEHILSRKTVNLPYGMISTMVENAGGNRNASTGQDFTNYYETVPPQYLETMLWTHAERMARPVVDQAVFDAERSIVKEELRQRVYAPPYGRFGVFVIGDNEYDNSIYRRPVIGSIEQLDSTVIEDARAFHEAYYRPSQATLIVSGNFDPAQLDRWVDQYFAGIQNPARPVPVFERPVSAPRTQPRNVVAYAPNVPLPAVAVIWPGVDASHPDNAALEILQAVLSRGQNSRLYQAMVYETQLASNASFGVDSMEEAGSITANAIVAQGKDIGDVERAMDGVFDRIRNEPITEAELQEAKTELIAADLRQRETANGRAFMLGQAIVSENDPTAPDRRIAALQSVTIADVQRVAQHYLVGNARVNVRYMDESQRPEGVSADSYRNPAPVPTFLTVPPAILPPNELLPEGQRMAPPAPGAARAMAAPQIVERTLPNGLRVIVAKSTDLPIMNAQLIIGGGSSADPAGRNGVAQLTAGLAREGAGGRSSPQIAAALESLGANLFAGAGSDNVTVSLSAPVASADAAGAIFADVVTEPAFAAAEVERARTRAQNNLRVALRDPATIGGLVLNRVVFGDAAYGAPASGTADSLAAITRDDIAAYHDAWWRPDNAALVITGGMTPDQAFAFAERTMGGWEQPATARPAVPARVGATTAPRIIVVDLPGAGQAAVTAAVRAPLRTDEAYYPLLVTNAIVGGGQNGHLFQEVRAKRGLSYGANSGVQARSEASMLVASTQTKNESAAEVLGLVLFEFDRLKTEAVTETATTDRETYITGGFSSNLETTGGLGNFIAQTVQFGLPLSELQNYPDRVRATTPQAIMAAANATLGSDRAYVVIVGDAKMFIDAVRAAHPDVQVIPAADLDLSRGDLGME